MTDGGTTGPAEEPHRIVVSKVHPFVDAVPVTDEPPRSFLGRLLLGWTPDRR